jgi:hypothetical protein
MAATFATGSDLFGVLSAAGLSLAGALADLAAIGAAAAAIRTVNSFLHAGHRTFLPCKLLAPLNLCLQCEHSIAQTVGATAFSGAALAEAFALACGDGPRAAAVGALLAVAIGGIETTALHAGQATRLPASSSGALSFFAHFEHWTICGMAPTSAVIKVGPASRAGPRSIDKYRGTLGFPHGRIQHIHPTAAFVLTISRPPKKLNLF